MQYDIIVVGCGISGATIAERCAMLLNKKVLILEKRDHIGGNCYDYYDTNGVLVSRYGAHLFHTNFEEVWEYINRFDSWNPYVHKVVASVDGKLVPVPVNITTVNLLLGTHIQNEAEMKEWLSTQVVPIANPKNSEESGLSRVGPKLYEALFKQYTQKQWDKSPTELAAAVLDRIPVRTNFDDRYFSDKYQAQPANGYTHFFERLLDHPNIHVSLNTDYFEYVKIHGSNTQVFFTGPIDQYFASVIGKKLEYRSIRFQFEQYNYPYFQSNSVVNYPNDHEYTRIVEYKHITRQTGNHTTISREFPTWEGEPYYPVLSENNLDLYAQFQKLAAQEEQKGVYFVGRLANYKYYNMDQAFKNALDTFARIFPNS
ncbi:UDP-galactopyranose mutase [Candidatus Microgenomates bacterium]|nr:UDP-galactopyranose mutase [Candidatus Microgenomates bacterium]